MTCTCSERGWCPVLGIHTTEQLRRICEKNHSQAKRIAAGMVASKSKPVVEEVSAARRERIARNVAARQRLISWLKLFRLPHERGIGDTANRLRLQRRKPGRRGQSDTQEAVKRLLSQCSCNNTQAVSRLNAEYPY